MTFIKACPNCQYELDLDYMSIAEDNDNQIQCPNCYDTVSVPRDYWELER